MITGTTKTKEKTNKDITRTAITDVQQDKYKLECTQTWYQNI